MPRPETPGFDPREPIIPDGWPSTDRPLTIALLGWARLAYQATQGSGYNLSASELAAGLVMSGHRVIYLASGRKYNLIPWMYIAHTERWRGVECFDLINSPNLSPASYNFGNMPAERRCPRQTAAVVAWLKSRSVQVVHIHSLEGFSLDLVPSLRDAGLPVVITPHNYWYACPQVDLMHQERHLCLDFDGGRKCDSCLHKRHPGTHRLKRRLGQAVESIVGQEATGAARLLVKALKRRLAGFDNPTPVAPCGDPEIASGLNPRAGEFDDGLIRSRLAPEPTDTIRKPVSTVAIEANEAFLSATHHLTVLNNYGQRRADGIASLNAASLVTPPSDFVRRSYIRMGLADSRTRIVRLGQPHFDQLHRRAKRSPYYTQRPWDPQRDSRPLRLAFLGAMRPSKGIDVLAEAIPQLPRDIRQRCQFHIRAQGFDWPVRKKLAAYPEVAFAGGYDILQLLGEAGEYDVGLLPHVWFENSPLVLLEHLHAGKFVIASRLGGVVEWIDPPRNGLLFAGGHADQLADCIERLVTGRIALPSPSEVHEATPLLRSYPDHVQEFDRIYASLASGESTPSNELLAPALLIESAPPRQASGSPAPMR